MGGLSGCFSFEIAGGDDVHYVLQAKDEAIVKAEPARKRMPQELTHREGFSDFVPN